MSEMLHGVQKGSRVQISALRPAKTIGYEAISEAISRSDTATDTVDPASRLRMLRIYVDRRDERASTALSRCWLLAHVELRSARGALSERLSASGTMPSSSARPRFSQWGGVLRHGLRMIAASVTQLKSIRAVLEAMPARETVAESAPCDNCRFRERCGVEQLVCDRFAMFCQGLPQWRWQSAPTCPTRARFLTLFGEAR
jgi:hypothetical protein